MSGNTNGFGMSGGNNVGFGFGGHGHGGHGGHGGHKGGHNKKHNHHGGKINKFTCLKKNGTNQTFFKVADSLGVVSHNQADLVGYYFYIPRYDPITI